MKTLAAVLLCTVSLFGQTVTDASTKCPLVVSGTPAHVVGVNKGTKEIIAYSKEFVATTADPDTPPNRLHFTYDYFFKPNTIKVGEAVELQPLPPDAIAPNESFTVVTKYLQFADGTEWGNPLDWPDRVQVRKEVLSLIQRAAAAYQTGGDDGLQTLLTTVKNTQGGTGMGQVVAAHLLRIGIIEALSELQMREMMAKAHASVTK